jgi:hypothetical protein
MKYVHPIKPLHSLLAAPRPGTLDSKRLAVNPWGWRETRKAKLIRWWPGISKRPLRWGEPATKDGEGFNQEPSAGSLPNRNSQGACGPTGDHCCHLTLRVGLALELDHGDAEKPVLLRPPLGSGRPPRLLAVRSWLSHEAHLARPRRIGPLSRRSGTSAPPSSTRRSRMCAASTSPGACGGSA